MFDKDNYEYNDNSDENGEVQPTAGEVVIK